MLLSLKARKRVRIVGLDPLYFECKNVEAFEINGVFWTGALGVVDSALQQIRRATKDRAVTPVVVVSKNRNPILVAIGVPSQESVLRLLPPVLLRGGSSIAVSTNRVLHVVYMPLKSFLEVLRVFNGDA